MDHREELLKIYKLLDGYFGDLHWWPAANPFEVMVGAILTQNTAWTNVETAIKALRKRRLLTPAALSRIPEDDLAEIIRASGYYHLKAARLKALVRFFMDDYSGNVTAMKAERLPVLREKLLAVRGVGPETADSILLYACQKPIFVSDAYTRRILLRHGLIDGAADYDGIQSLVMASLPNSVELFNQFHALIVVAAKTFCRKRPECAKCPLAVINSEEMIC
ncbi:MAG: endonuclease III domain-containing protein [Syntrophaceae bacterium]|nr:endonuclease III domain-containing protein [Syntrophaceae bacterium]